jgi:hypothetical protein
MSNPFVAAPSGATRRIMQQEVKPMSLTILRAAVKRTGDVGIDLPAGACAGSLSATDYHLVDMEPEDKIRSGVVGADLPAGASSAQLRLEDYGALETEQHEA